MYTKQQVDDMLSQVEREFEKTLGSIVKSEKVEEQDEEIAEEEQSLEKSEESEEEVEYTEEDYKTVDDLYSSMSKSEIEAHYSSIKRVMFGDEAMEKSDDDEDLSPHGKEQKAKQAQKQKVVENMASGAINRGYDSAVHSEDKSAQKSEDEDEDEDEKKCDSKKMKKSEISIIKAENEELKKSVETMTELLNKLFNSGKKAPTQKAITGIDYIAKSEESETKGLDISKMSKSEITSKLKSVNYAELSKSDRDCINDFYLNNGSVEKIKHLIKE